MLDINLDKKSSIVILAPDGALSEDELENAKKWILSTK
jgi:hypothetical protein